MMNKFNKIKIDYIMQVILLAGILLFLGLICNVNIFHFNYRMNADIASDAVLTGLIWNSGEICPSTWYVANELRIICTPNVASIIYGITQDAVLSMGIACSVMTIVIAISIYLFMRTINASTTTSLGVVLLSLLLPASFDSLELLYLFASYYAIHVVLLFFAITTYAKSIREKTFPIFLAGIQVLFAIILGMQGVRGILIIYVPLFGVEVVRNLYQIYSGKTIKKNDIYLLCWSGALLLFSYLGTLFPGSVPQGISRNLRKGFSKLFAIVFPDILGILGFQNLNIVGVISLLILCLGAIYLLGYNLYKLVRKEEMEFHLWAYLVLWCSPVASAIIVAFSTAESSKRYYFIFIFTLALSTAWLICKSNKSIKAILIIASLIVMIQNLSSIYLPILGSEDPPRGEALEVVEYLDAEGYRNAYATFENANTMTVLANDVRVAPVATVEKMDICKWMTSTDWYAPNVPYEQETVYIITETEMEQFKSFLAKHKDGLEELPQIGKYHLFLSPYNYSNLGEEKN